MKQIVIFLVFSILTIALLSFQPNSAHMVVLPASETVSDLEKHASTLDSANESFLNHIENLEIDLLRSEFLSLRSKFKEIEFLVAYIDPQLFNQSLNGAPLPKIMKKVPDLTVIEPQGLQRLEELIYEERVNRKELKRIFVLFSQNWKQFNNALRHRKLVDADVLESVRFGIIRLQTMGTTAFDAPGNSEKTLHECAQTLRGMKSAMSRYEPYLEDVLNEELLSLFDKGIDQCEGTELYNDFDHVTFFKEVLDPLWKKTLIAQGALKIELPHHRSQIPSPLNYEASSLLANDFLKADFYADFIGENNRDLKVSLGEILFFDPILSTSNERACASCHDPMKGFTDGLPKSLTNEQYFGLRNAPTILNAIYASEYFHDIRADRLSFQMDHVVFSPDEFNTDYNEIVAKLSKSNEYRGLFTDIYGREGITKNTITNAVAAYVASKCSFNSPFDQYMRGEISVIDEAVIRGYNLFQGKAACGTCHFSPTFAGNVPPNFEESETEVLGVPSTSKAPYELDADVGRWGNKRVKEKVEFYRYSFKTPTLRNIEYTGPYMHNGGYENLESVLDFYNQGGGQGLGLDVQFQTLPSDSLELSKHEKADIISFLKSLSDTVGMNHVPSRLPSFPEELNLNSRVIGGKY